MIGETQRYLASLNYSLDFGILVIRLHAKCIEFLFLSIVTLFTLGSTRSRLRYIFLYTFVPWATFPTVNPLGLHINRRLRRRDATPRIFFVVRSGRALRFPPLSGRKLISMRPAANAIGRLHHSARRVMHFAIRLCYSHSSAFWRGESPPPPPVQCECARGGCL
jgi:hypothetical protein